MLDKGKVFVEGGADEVNIQTANLMGPDNAISQKQLKDLQEKVKDLTLQNDSLKRDWVTKEATLTSLNKKALDEKAMTERRVYEQEFLVQKRDQEIERLRDQNL